MKPFEKGIDRMRFSLFCLVVVERKWLTILLAPNKELKIIAEHWIKQIKVTDLERSREMP